ncbi:MAG: HTTM domain-containing protein [Flavobacteriales bacterium]
MNKFLAYIQKPVHIAPLAMFRVLFGGMMFFSILRFAFKGWIYDLYIKPSFYFTYMGFSWVKPLGEVGMYLVFIALALSFLFVMLGYFYRFASVSAFVLFTYVELIDKSNYLNHYYFISIVSFLMCFLPAYRYFSIDVWRKPTLKVSHVPFWMTAAIKLQLGMVYFFAGLAKINYDWLFNAMPLRLWLPPRQDMPIIGTLFTYTWVAYFFSWFGCIYDLTIPFFLCFKKTRTWAYVFVILFHVLTGMLFYIGMFPYIMIVSTLVFFNADFHLKIIAWFNKLFRINSTDIYLPLEEKHSVLRNFLLLFFSIQIILPFRYAAYSGKLFWHEEGFRFSWRVMLMEKGGYAIFKVKDKDSGRSWEVRNYDFLTPVQEKIMSTQPDMILQFAHFLAEKYHKKGMPNVEIKVECYVTLNGSPSRLLINPEVDLTKVNESFKKRDWVLPFEE